MLRKATGILLILVLCLSIAGPAWAAVAAPNVDVDAKIAVMEQKYDIRIRYDKDPDGTACVGTGTLAILDKALEKVTPQVVKQVSAYVSGKTGSKLTYSFTYNYNVSIDLAAGTEAHAVFHQNTGVIEVFMPSSSKGTVSSGDNPLAMTHEFGHALYLLLESKYPGLAADWKALNGGLSYRCGYSGSGVFEKTAFITEYATYDHEEDFCETFAHAMVRDQAGLGFYHLLKTEAGGKTVLGKKVDFLMTMLPKYLTGTETVVANLGKAYTTRIYLDWQGQRLTGVHMQYMGNTGPRYVLRGIMADPAVNDEIASSLWVSEIGGWYVTSTSGKYYLVYPGGVVRQQSAPLALTK